MSEIKTPEEFWKDTQFEKQYETSFGFAKRYAEYYHRQALEEVLERLYQASCDFKMHPVDRLAMLRELIEKEYEQSKLQDDE